MNITIQADIKGLCIRFWVHVRFHSKLYSFRPMHAIIKGKFFFLVGLKHKAQLQMRCMWYVISIKRAQHFRLHLLSMWRHAAIHDPPPPLSPKCRRFGSWRLSLPYHYYHFPLLYFLYYFWTYFVFMYWLTDWLGLLDFWRKRSEREKREGEWTKEIGAKGFSMERRRGKLIREITWNHDMQPELCLLS